MICVWALRRLSLLLHNRGSITWMLCNRRAFAAAALLFQWRHGTAMQTRAHSRKGKHPARRLLFCKPQQLFHSPAAWADCRTFWFPHRLELLLIPVLSNRQTLSVLTWKTLHESDNHKLWQRKLMVMMVRKDKPVENCSVTTTALALISPHMSLWSFIYLFVSQNSLSLKCAHTVNVSYIKT